MTPLATTPELPQNYRATSTQSRLRSGSTEALQLWTKIRGRLKPVGGVKA